MFMFLSKIAFKHSVMLRTIFFSLGALAVASSANSADVKTLELQADQFQQALTLAQANKLDQALSIWTALSNKKDVIPELKRALDNNIAVVFVKQKQYEAAKKRLDMALNADVQVATARENLNQLYAFEAQKAYQKIFKKTAVTAPKAQWLYFDVKRAQLPNDQVITDINQADASRLVKQAIENWRQAWSGQNLSSYLSFYDKTDFIPKQGMSYQTWKEGRYRSLTYPKFIDVKLDDIQITPISATMMRTRFLQRYHSNLFKDDIYKVLLWQKKAGQWKIVQEVVLDEAT